MESLIDAVRAEHEDQRGKALEAYRECLVRADAPEPGDKLTTVRAMGVLGFSAERMERDLEIVRKAQRLEERAHAATDAATAKELSAKAKLASDMLKSFDAETAELERARKSERERIVNAWKQSSGRLERARSAARELQQLREAHRELFGLPTPAPEQPINRVRETAILPQRQADDRPPFVPTIGPRTTPDGRTIYG